MSTNAGSDAHVVLAYAQAGLMEAMKAAGYDCPIGFDPAAVREEKKKPAPRTVKPRRTPPPA